MDRSVYRACWIRDPHINFGTSGVRFFHFLVSFWKFSIVGVFSCFVTFPQFQFGSFVEFGSSRCVLFYKGNNEEGGTGILVLSQVNAV